MKNFTSICFALCTICIEAMATIITTDVSGWTFTEAEPLVFKVEEKASFVVRDWREREVASGAAAARIRSSRRTRRCPAALLRRRRSRDRRTAPRVIRGCRGHGNGPLHAVAVPVPARAEEKRESKWKRFWQSCLD